MVVGYFMTSSHTEVGGLHAFLQKMVEDAGAHHVKLERLFPAVKKPGPKPKPSSAHTDRAAALPQPLASAQGITGAPLVERMLRRLELHHRRQPPDIILLEDDADCRFNTSDSTPADEQAAFENVERELNQKVEQVLGKAVPVIALLASPEVEAWFLADWEMSFVRQYPSLSIPLKKYLETLPKLGSELGDMPSIERFGGACLDGACTHKLSDTLMGAFQITREADSSLFQALESLRVEGKQAAYSKRTDGPFMLSRIRPQKVAEHCTLYFRPTYQKLLRLLHPSV
ncbi:MAG: hypothetical protein ACKO6N_00300 [Myxococcota bacterium]